jgi:phage tail-like protein
MVALAVPTDRFRHDPTSVLLPRAVGWEPARLSDVVERGRRLRLALDGEQAGLSFVGPESSLGGLVPPAHVAVDRAGNTFLLDREEGRLYLVDPCDCALHVVPALGGAGNGARELNGPLAIAAGRRSVYVADTGNRRVTVLDIGTYQLRTHLAPPDPASWSPVDVAVGRAGRVLVADALGGRVHAFSATGRYRGIVVDGVPAVARVACDLDGRIYIGLPGENVVRVFSRDGDPRDAVDGVEPLAGRFPPLPFEVAADGSIDFGWTAGDLRCVVGPNLDLPDAPPSTSFTYAASGRYVSPRLDSRLPDCQWHRVILTGRLPEGSRVTLRTASSGLPGDAPKAADRRWSSPVDLRPTGCDAGSEQRWDAIVLAGPGRYLWLELTLHGDSTVTPSISFAEVEYPRVSLRRYLPAVYGEQPEARDFLDRFLSVFDTGFRSVERQIDGQAAWFDLRTAPAGEPDVLGWLASWIGLTADRSLPLERRRAVLIAARDELPRRGTIASLRRVVLSWLGLDSAGEACATCLPGRCDPPRRPCGVGGLEQPPWHPPALVLEHFRLRRWLMLGPSRIGDRAHLWGTRITNRSQLDVSAQADETQLIVSQDPDRDLFHHFAHKFTVFLPARLVADERKRRALTLLIRDESPAHTRFEFEAVEPRLRVGVQSTIGFDAVVGRWPRSAILAGTSTQPARSRLGEAVLGGRLGPEMVIGRARTGTTTRLE